MTSKEEKEILELFKKKNVLQHALRFAPSVNKYNFLASTAGYDKLTEKQFELLKEFYEEIKW